MFIVYNIIAVSCICQQYMMDCNKIITRPVRLRLTFSQGVIIIKKLNNKSCDGDSRSAGNASESRGWWEPGASNAGLNITPELSGLEKGHGYPGIQGGAGTCCMVSRDAIPALKGLI